MVKVPSKVEQRIVAGIKRFQPVLTNSKSRDDGEADTVTIITDMLQDVFGYDKYAEITAEHAIRGTFCDLAIKIDGKLECLLEAKAIGLELKDNHVKQAVDYAANQGIDWVILTNGICWRVYHVTFSKPIEHELVVEIDFLKLNAKADQDIELLYLWSKEGWQKDVLSDYHTQQQALSRFFIGAMLTSEEVLDGLRRFIRRAAPEVKVESEQIGRIIETEIIKREILESEKFQEARRRITRAQARSARSKGSKDEAESMPPTRNAPVTSEPCEPLVNAGSSPIVKP